MTWLQLRRRWVMATQLDESEPLSDHTCHIARPGPYNPTTYEIWLGEVHPWHNVKIGESNETTRISTRV